MVATHCGLYPPPPGVTPNCVNPETQTASNIALHTIMIFLAACSLCVRLYTRSYITRSVGLDDYLCILGFALLVTYSAVLLTCGKYYLGHHIWDIPKANFLKGLKYEVIAEWIYIFISPTLKLAVLWLYHRIFGPQTRVHYIINGGMIFIIIAYNSLFFMSLLDCMPVARRFNPFTEGQCLPSGVTAYSSGAINVFTDAFVVLLPVPAIWKLNMQPMQKVRAMAVFGIGIIVLALSITRLAKTPLVFKETDATWTLSNFAIYSILELYFGLMCACFLASPSFLDRFGPIFLRRIRSYTSSLRISRSGSSRRSASDNATYDAKSDDSGSRKGTVFGGAVATHESERGSERGVSVNESSKESTTSLQPYDVV